MKFSVAAGCWTPGFTGIYLCVWQQRALKSSLGLVGWSRDRRDGPPTAEKS